MELLPLPTQAIKQENCLMPMLGFNANVAADLKPLQMGAAALGNGANASMDTNITLWQFLLEMLSNGDHGDLIQWTNNEGEFKVGLFSLFLFSDNQFKTFC